MTSREALLQLLEQNNDWLKNTITNISRGSQSEFNLDDLEQDLYLQTLESEKEYETVDDLRWYLVKSVIQSIYSKTSAYHRMYRKPTQYKPIEDIHDK